MERTKGNKGKSAHIPYFSNSDEDIDNINARSRKDLRIKQKSSARQELLSERSKLFNKKITP